MSQTTATHHLESLIRSIFEEGNNDSLKTFLKQPEHGATPKKFGYSYLAASKYTTNFK
jgi:hypothetical protein